MAHVSIRSAPGMPLQCPCCGESCQITVSLLVPDEFFCDNCKEHFSGDRVLFYIEDLWSRIDNWLNVLNWCAAMPAECPVPAEPFEEEAA
jgi:hypothetical protein